MTIENEEQTVEEVGGLYYHISLKLGLEFFGEDIPCEKTILDPIKEFIKNHIKAYKKTTRIVILKSGICEAEYGEVDDDNSE